MDDQRFDFPIRYLDNLALGQLALRGVLPASGSLLLDRDIGWAAIDPAQGYPVGVLVARPAMLCHTLILRRPDWITSRRLVERVWGWMDGDPRHPKTALFQVAPDNATMGRLATRLGATADIGQLWRIDI